MRAYFVTGTDTDVGKTYSCVALLQAMALRGLATLGLKPVAAGAEMTRRGQWRNDDALALRAASTCEVDYAATNPYCLPAPLSPHIAAAQAGVSLTASAIAGSVTHTLDTACADWVLVEGAGGWYVPINASETMADVARRLNLPVLLVVGMRLGCLNHALLTAEAIARDGLALHGWIANCIDPQMTAIDDNIATLEARIPAPLVLRLNRNGLAESDISKSLI